MKPVLYSVFILIACEILILSCKKEYSCEGCAANNKPPLAVAGPDKIIVLPTDSVLLDGSASSDVDGNITGWEWKKISGPASFAIATTGSPATVVRMLVTGTYAFELKVTDNSGSFAKDTVSVVVDPVPIMNHPPVAHAGADQVITLPSNSVTLDGSGSTDPDSNIITYSWARISGPASFSMPNSNSVIANVTNLTEGNYLFVLQVSDAGGLFSNDTVQVTVKAQTTMPDDCDSNRPIINAQLIPVGSLSQYRSGIAVVSAGNRIFFAGGVLPSGSHSSRVDILDIPSQTWSTAELSLARFDIATVASGNKVFFAGGENGDGTSCVARVDIYDLSTNTWSVATLSEPRNEAAAAAAGNKVFFAGGCVFSNTVDVYDLSTNTWSVAYLSQGRRIITAVSAFNKIYFAGGEAPYNNPDPSGPLWIPSDRVDIYDNSTNDWSYTTMMEGKEIFTGIAIGGRIYLAGGLSGMPGHYYTSCQVEMKNVFNGASTMLNLSRPGAWRINLGQQAVLKDNKIVFPFFSGTNKFDIYDVSTYNWSIGSISQIINGSSVISVNNIIYVAGGSVNGSPSNQVWRLEF